MDTSKTVLVIDDDVILAHALSVRLTNDGIRVLQAENGEMGLEMALEKKPDFIVLDVIMPKIDGMTMLKRLREDEWGKDVPVMLLTNLDKSCNELAAQGAPNCSCFIKSNCKIAEVIAEIEKHLA